jgi:hypothetical protein
VDIMGWFRKAPTPDPDEESEQRIAEAVKKERESDDLRNRLAALESRVGLIEKRVEDD